VVRDLLCVDSRFIHQLIDPVGAGKHHLLELTRVESSVLLFLVVFLIRVDTLGFTGSGFMSPQFYVFFPFFNNIYEYLTNVGLEWSVRRPLFLTCHFAQALSKKN